MDNLLGTILYGVPAQDPRNQDVFRSRGSTDHMPGREDQGLLLLHKARARRIRINGLTDPKSMSPVGPTGLRNKGTGRD